MLLFWVFQTVVAAAMLGLLITAWVIGRLPRESADQKPSSGRRAAILLLRIQTLVPLPLFALDNLISVDPTQQQFLLFHWSSRIIFYLALLGEVLIIPVIWMWVRYGHGKRRVIGVLTSVLCALLILLLVAVSAATA